MEDAIARQFGKQIRSIPLSLAKAAAKTGDLLALLPINSRLLDKIVQSDTYNDEKARRELGWQPVKVLDFFCPLSIKRR